MFEYFFYNKLIKQFRRTSLLFPFRDTIKLYKYFMSGSYNNITDILRHAKFHRSQYNSLIIYNRSFTFKIFQNSFIIKFFIIIMQLHLKLLDSNYFKCNCKKSNLLNSFHNYLKHLKYSFKWKMSIGHSEKL